MTISILSRLMNDELDSRVHYNSIFRFITRVNGHHPSSKIFERHMLEPNVLHHSFQLLLRRKLSDALDKILIRSFIASDDLAELGNDVEAVKVVHRS